MHRDWDDWYTAEEIDDLLPYLSIIITISNEYFDTSDLDNPIKSSLKTLEFVLSPSTFTYSHIGIIKNTYEINQGILYPDTQTGTFFEIDQDVVTSSIGNNKRPRFGLFEISMRKQGTHNDVHVYTFLDA